MAGRIRDTAGDSRLVGTLRTIERLIIGERKNDPALLEGAVAITKEALDRFLDSAEGDGAKMLLEATGSVIPIAYEAANLERPRFGNGAPVTVEAVHCLTGTGYATMRHRLGDQTPTFVPIMTDALARRLYDQSVRPAFPAGGLQGTPMRINSYLRSAIELLAEAVIVSHNHTTRPAG